MIFNFYKKIIIGLVLISLVLNPSFFINKTRAQVTDPAVVAKLTELNLTATQMLMNLDIVTLNTTSLAAKAKHDIADTWVQKLLKLAGQALKKLVLDRIVEATKKWILRGGFEGTGGPVIGDWGAFFQQAGEETVGMIAQENLPWLCAPIKLNVALSLFAPAKFETSVACTLNGIVGNIDNLFKDFRKESKGRWITYNTLWEPQNNFFGVTLATENQKELTLADILKSKTIDATVNLGYKSQEQCYIDQETKQKTCRTLTPGNQIAQAAWNTATNQTKVLGIISADDTAAYIGALLDAVIYRYGILAIGGISKALGYNDSDNTNTAYADYQAATFSQINSIIFKNDRTLFTETFNTILGIKRNTLLALNQSIAAETTLKSQLTALQNCTINGATFSQSTRLAELQTRINDANTTLDGLAEKNSQIQSGILIIQTTQNQFNAMDPQDSANEDLMVRTYNNLVANGTLDTQAANQALTDAKAELTNIQDNAKNILQTTSDTGGYQDIIAACASQITIH